MRPTTHLVQRRTRYSLFTTDHFWQLLNWLNNSDVVKCIAFLCNERVHAEWQKYPTSWNNCTILSCSTIPCIFISFSFRTFWITIPHLFFLSYLLFSLRILYLLSAISTFSGDNLWSTAMDWMPQFEHLDALKQLFPDRYCIMLQLLTIMVHQECRTWTYSFSHLISSPLIASITVLSSPLLTCSHPPLLSLPVHTLLPSLCHSTICILWNQNTCPVM